MTALTGLLDGETAAALRALYSKTPEGAEELQVEPAEGEAHNWADYEESSDSKSYCENCEDELIAGEPTFTSSEGEVLCGECDRRANTHAVGRFTSVRSREKDLD